MLPDDDDDGDDDDTVSIIVQLVYLCDTVLFIHHCPELVIVPQPVVQTPVAQSSDHIPSTERETDDRHRQADRQTDRHRQRVNGFCSYR